MGVPTRGARVPPFHRVPFPPRPLHAHSLVFPVSLHATRTIPSMSSRTHALRLRRKLCRCAQVVFAHLGWALCARRICSDTSSAVSRGRVVRWNWSGSARRRSRSSRHGVEGRGPPRGSCVGQRSSPPQLQVEGCTRRRAVCRCWNVVVKFGPVCDRVLVSSHSRILALTPVAGS